MNQGAMLDTHAETARASGRVTVGTVTRGLGVELRDLLATFELTPVSLWLRFAAIAAFVACIGLLPFGALSLATQTVAFGLVALVLVRPGAVARRLRSSDRFGVRERDSVRVFTHLPAAVAVATLPVYLCAQAVLFWRVMRHVPGVLSGSTWSDAWRYSLDSLLFTELFLDVFDVFGFGLAPDPPTVAGRVLVFACRLLLSVGFVRVALTLIRAAYYRAHGLGRGEDTIEMIERAATDGDAVHAGHLGRELTGDVRATVEALVQRRVAGDNSLDTQRSLRALRDWAVPYLRARIAAGDVRADTLESLVPELTGSWEHPDPEPPRLRPSGIALLAFAVTAIAVFIAIGPAPLAFGVGALAMLVLVWLLASPRASFEAAMERGLVPYVTLSHLRGRVLAWSALLAAAFVLASWGTLTAAAAAWPGAFGPEGTPVDARTVLGFVGSSLLRVQYTLSIPDVFHLGESGIEQRPLLGSLLTFLLRAGLDFGVAAVIVAAMSIRRDVQGFSGLFSVPDTLGIRVEALRGGRYAYLLVMHYDLDVCGRLWRALDHARDADTQEALAASGAFDWCAQHESLGPPLSAERLVAQAVVIEALSRRGWLGPAGGWASEMLAALEDKEWPAAARAQVYGRLAAVAALDGAPDGAFGLIANAYEALLEDRDGGAPDDPSRTSIEAQGVWARSVTRILGTLPPDALERGVTSELAERADEVVAALVDREPARFMIDALRLGTVRAPLVARTVGATAGLDMLTNVSDVAQDLPRHHPWREVLLLNLVGAASAVGAVATASGEPAVSGGAADLEAVLMEDVGREDDDVDPRELTARAHDERLAEELAHSVGALSAAEPSGAAYAAAMRAADLFEARFDSGIDEARTHAVEMRLFAALTAFRVEAWADVVSAAEHVYRLSDGTRPSPSDQHLLANTHAFHAQASRCVGDDAAAAHHAAAARALYDRVAASDWAEAAAAVSEGRAYLEGL